MMELISQPPFGTVRLVRDLPLEDRAGVGAAFFLILFLI